MTFQGHQTLQNVTCKNLHFVTVNRNTFINSLHFDTVNKNTCPGDKSALHPGGLRIGAPALTSRQFKTADFEKVADYIDQGIKLGLEIQEVSGTDFKKFLETLKEEKFQARITSLRDEVEEFALKFPMPGHDIM